MDIGEVEMSGKDKSRQPVPGKSRSLKEAARSEGAAEGPSKPVRLGAQGPRGAAVRGRRAPGAAKRQCCCPLPCPAICRFCSLCLQAATPLLCFDGLFILLFNELSQLAGGLSCGEGSQEGLRGAL